MLHFGERTFSKWDNVLQCVGQPSCYVQDMLSQEPTMQVKMHGN